MNNLFRGLIAGYGAKKLGGGCFGTIIVFILIWVALGQCNCTTIERSNQQEEKQIIHQSHRYLEPTGMGDYAIG